MTNHSPTTDPSTDQAVTGRREPHWRRFGTLEPDPATAELLARADELADAGEVFAAIDLLTEQNRIERNRHLEFRLVHLRHEASHHLEHPPPPAAWPHPVEDVFGPVEGCPTVDVADLTPELVASAVTHHGCLLVRRLVDAAGVEALVRDIDIAFAASRAKVFARVGSHEGSWYQPFKPRPEDPPPYLGHRYWVQEGGGVLAADSPPAFFTMAEEFERAGVQDLVTTYLGERPVWSVDKCTLRRVPVDLAMAEWHQDGQFLGEGIRVLNLWLALSPCGGEISSPGLDILPKRYDHILPTGSDGAWLDWAVGPELVLRESHDAPLIRPEFQPGDALFFDEMLVHRTAIDPGMQHERYAIESWFFAHSAYPDGPLPIVF